VPNSLLERHLYRLPTFIVIGDIRSYPHMPRMVLFFHEYFQGSIDSVIFEDFIEQLPQQWQTLAQTAHLSRRYAKHYQVLSRESISSCTCPVGFQRVLTSLHQNQNQNQNQNPNCPIEVANSPPFLSLLE